MHRLKGQSSQLSFLTGPRVGMLVMKLCKRKTISENDGLSSQVRIKTPKSITSKNGLLTQETED